VVVLACVPSVALGASVSVSSFRQDREECRDIGTCELAYDVLYQAPKGEGNALTITQEEGGVFRFRDDGAPLQPGKGCVAVDANEVTCKAKNLFALTVELGNADDTATFVTMTERVTVSGGSGTDVLNGGAGDDLLDGGTGADTLSGGPGDDELTGGKAPESKVEPDVLDGGDGTDRVRYDDRKKPISVNLSDPAGGAGESGEGDSLVAIETVVGGSARDLLIGSPGPDKLEGSEANDLIRGMGGDDSLIGDEGADRLYGSAGRDTLEGWGGRDKLVGGCGRDSFEGGGGSDRILARDGLRDRIEGGPLENLKDRDFAAVDAGIDSVKHVERLRKRPPPQAAC